MSTGNEKFIEGKVSVVTPVFNGESHLFRMLESVLRQTYPQIEVILSDDGSTEKSIRKNSLRKATVTVSFRGAIKMPPQRLTGGLSM